MLRLPRRPRNKPQEQRAKRERQRCCFLASGYGGAQSHRFAGRRQRVSKHQEKVGGCENAASLNCRRPPPLGRFVRCLQQQILREISAACRKAHQRQTAQRKGKHGDGQDSRRARSQISQEHARDRVGHLSPPAGHRGGRFVGGMANIVSIQRQDISAGQFRKSREAIHRRHDRLGDNPVEFMNHG